jgi:hypothetical protein
MPFDASDPRSALATLVEPSLPPPEAFAEPQVIPFADDLAEISALGSLSWTVRTQNFVVVYTAALAGETFSRDADAFEHLVVVPDETTLVHISAEGAESTLLGPSLAVVPPGASRVRVARPGVIIRIFTAAALDVVAGSLNAVSYQEVPPNVRVLNPACAPSTLATYFLADHPASPDRFGHIFRSQNLMFNFVPTRHGPRDLTKLSPHSHGDFEQCTIQLGGEFVHHARTPWTADGTTWREDVHLPLGGAGIVIFPPPLVHTSQAVGPGANRLCDVFSPVRSDFLSRDGWVLNAGDYSGTDPAAQC